MKAIVGSDASTIPRHPPSCSSTRWRSNTSAEEVSSRFSGVLPAAVTDVSPAPPGLDRKSTRLNSSHANISYAVFCLKKKSMPLPRHNLSTTIALHLLFLALPLNHIHINHIRLPLSP